MTRFPYQSKGFHPFAELIGLEFTRVEPDAADCRLDVRPEHFNPNGVVHGGVLYSLVDTAMGAAITAGLAPGQSCATVEIKIHYFRAVRAGALACACATIHRTRKFAVLEADVHLEDVAVAKALGTFSILDSPQATEGV